jgi:guanylate kinase
MADYQTKQQICMTSRTVEKGQLFVVSGPSGAGKTVLCRKVLTEIPGLCYSISHTTRPRRLKEVSGKDYFFVKRDQFEQMIEQGRFLEWAEVHGNLYGTAKEYVYNTLNQRQDVIMDIDVQGARQIRKQQLPCVLVFVVPPSMEQLEKRLRGRGTDTAEQIELRIQNAAQELSFCPDYDYLVINEAFDQAQLELKSIILAERCRNRKQ